MEAKKLVEKVLDSDLSEEEVSRILLDLVHDPQGAKAIEDVFEERGILSRGSWDRIQRSIEEEHFQKKKIDISLAHIWDRLSEVIRPLLESMRIDAEIVMEPEPVYLDSRSEKGKLVVELREPDGGYKKVGEVPTGQPASKAISVAENDVLRIRLFPSTIGHGFAFAGGLGEIPRLVYPNNLDQPIVASPEQPTTLIWQVDPAPRLLKISFLLVSNDVFEENIANMLVRDSEGGWTVESEMQLLESIKKKEKPILEVAETHLSVVY